MAKHTLRCSICSKFVTWHDMADDGICESCARRSEAYARERAKGFRFILLVVALVWLLLAVTGWCVYSSIAYAGDQRFIEEYFVTGINEQTGERIIGWLNGELGSGEVQGTVWDRRGQFAVIGNATGCGLFELRSLCCTYVVEVADEVTNDKITNRKQWQESWK